MAKLCVMCGSLCAYFLLYFTSTALCSSNDYYHYTTDFQDDKFEYLLNIGQFGNEEHRLQKSDSQIESTGTQPNPTNYTTVVESQLKNTTDGVSVVNKTLTEDKLSSTGTDINEIQHGNKEHRLQKRDAQIESNQSNSRTQPNSTSVFTTNDTTVVQSQSKNTTDGVLVVNKTLTDDKLSSTKTKLGRTNKVLPNNVNATKLDTLHKNLGENGTGIRKNITTIQPILLPNPNQPLLKDQLNTTSRNDTEDEGTPLDDFPPDEQSDAFNKTLTEHHITNTTEDNHLYYNSTVQNDPEVGHFHWVDLTNRSDAKVNELLSKSHRRAATVQLSFEFPFYGHLIKNVTIATGGFLYTGDYVHSWLAATQYIAPLMANFDTSISNHSYIKYVDNGTAFTVEWEKVALQDKSNEGEFTFQATLHKNGDIVFVYQNVPLFIKNITDDHHPVKVGLSDAYIIDRTIFLVRRKTIYEYHRINFDKEDIRNWTVIYLTALPTCLQHQDCSSCVTKVIPSFQCYWCPSIKRCSNGVDRNRQDWLANHCQTKQVDETFCSHISGADIFDKSNTSYSHDVNEFEHQREGYSKTSEVYNNANALGSNQQPVSMAVSSIVAILFLIAMVAGLALWVLYAYRNPHTTSGQILIRYRPSQWRWRRGEARYTAATIHM